MACLHCSPETHKCQDECEVLPNWILYYNDSEVVRALTTLHLCAGKEPPRSPGSWSPPTPQASQSAELVLWIRSEQDVFLSRRMKHIIIHHPGIFPSAHLVQASTQCSLTLCQVERRDNWMFFSDKGPPTTLPTWTYDISFISLDKPFLPVHLCRYSWW